MPAGAQRRTRPTEERRVLVRSVNAFKLEVAGFDVGLRRLLATAQMTMAALRVGIRRETAVY